MVQFTAVIDRFGEMGEKTGWTYILIPPEKAQELMPGNKKAFRVKGKLDSYQIEQVAVMPWGDGSFLLAVNAAMRKGTGKKQGGTLDVRLELDKSDLEVPEELTEALADEPEALKAWEALAGSHRHYFIRWVSSAKGLDTRAWRVAATITSLLSGRSFGETLRMLKAERSALKR
jgi:hypothetical protein